MVARNQIVPAYGIAVVATALALLTRDLLSPLMGFEFSFRTFYPAVLLASWYGGLGPGLVAALLSTFSTLLFISPALPSRLAFPDALGLLIFTFTNILIAALCEKLHQTIRRAEEHAALLKESEERMRQAEIRKDEFLAMVSHELRTPLSNLVSGVYLLRTRSIEADVRNRAIEILDRQSRHMNRIVSDLLDISRIGQGKLQLTTEQLDLSLLVKETTEDFCRSVQKDLTVSIEAPSLPLWIQGDRTRIAQMLANLLQNAAKFTNAGGHITVGVRCEQSRAVVSVTDNGVGIERELLLRLFSVYTQGNLTLERTEGGLGLGLAIVKSLAELHGGSVEAYSPGKGLGSEFRFTLPLNTAQPMDAAIVRETILSPKQGAQRQGARL